MGARHGPRTLARLMHACCARHDVNTRVRLAARRRTRASIAERLRRGCEDAVNTMKQIRRDAGANESGRTGVLAVLRDFVQRVRPDAAKRTALVTSAAPLDAQLRFEVELGLARMYGCAIPATFVVDPELLGGMRLQIGSDVYDSSVRAGLAVMEPSLAGRS
jgi:F-type H+-transporting ATPase subunit delta